MPTVKSYSKKKVKTAGLPVESVGEISARAGQVGLPSYSGHAGLLSCTGILGVALIGLCGVTSQPASLLLVLPALELNQSHTACAVLN